MIFFKQTEEKNKKIKLGFGEGSLHDYGCYLVSLTNGLNQRGYSFTPESLNELFKTLNAWTGPSRNYIDVDHLDDYLPDIFNSFEKIEPWNDIPTTNELLKPDLIVVCKVNASVIGGSGTHFVLLTGLKDNVATIHDPWNGIEEKITVRWGKRGNILGLRIFTVKPYVPAIVTPITITDQTRIPQIENREVQAIRGELFDGRRTIETLKNEKETLNKESAQREAIMEDQEKELDVLDAKLFNVRMVVFGKGWTWIKISALKKLLA